ncbi:MAG: phage holin family protein [Chloroflexi bacterium]|nr:phage holin family protein [Chloroflexota bacterium]
MLSLLVRLIINAVGLYAATQLVPGLTFNGDWGTLAVVALIFGVVNALVRPLLRFLTCPLLVLTLGLFTFIINAFMLALTGWIAQQLHLGFQVNGFWAAFVGALVISIVSFVLTMLVREETRGQRYAH